MLTGLLTNNHLAASVNLEVYDQQVINKPTCDPVKGSNIEGCFYQGPKKPSVAKYPCPYWNQCVCYAKTLTGHFGTWGDGGKYLSDNSTPMVDVVIIFDYTHVGVIRYFDGYNIGYTDRNGLGNRQIRDLVWTTVDDPTIWKYHKF